MSKNNQPSITISRTIYDPATKDFITSTPDAKALPHIKQWINQHNPVIYWYILRIDNPSDASIDQWAVELYAHQALSITEVYVDGIDREFEVRKRERDPWSEKYVLSISREVGIPIIGKGTRRIFFKVDIDCKEGLMHEYGISGAFIAQGMGTVEIKEKMFQYSCKVGEFKQIFDNNPDEASHYAEKRLMGKYSSNSVQVFTNSFRMIYELYGYCHSISLNRDDLLHKLQLLHTSFESVPEIAGKRITPLIHDGIRELDIIVDRDKFAPRFMKLCDALVELLHMEVMSAEMKDSVTYTSPAEPVKADPQVNRQFNGNSRMECPTCRNFITESNKSLICTGCGGQFCGTCEEWFRDERKRGEGPLCRDCYVAEQERMCEVAERKTQMQKEKEERLEHERKEKEKEEQEKGLKAEQEKKAREEDERKKREEEEGKQKEAEVREKNAKETQDKLARDGNSIGMKFIHIPAGEYMMGSKNGNDDEQPFHKVTINKPFYLGIYPVTQRGWKAVMGGNPLSFKGNNQPVKNVSWDDVQEFIRKINNKEGTDKYRLPSEAEWEYAARAGTTTKYCFGDDESKLGEYAWYDGNSGSKTHPVGKKKPNPWGLYDIHGNVWEWLQDSWHDNYGGAPDDGSAWEDGNSSSQVLRGGSWGNRARLCRSASRVKLGLGVRGSLLGFRLLREL